MRPTPWWDDEVSRRAILERGLRRHAIRRWQQTRRAWPWRMRLADGWWRLRHGLRACARRLIGSREMAS